MRPVNYSSSIDDFHPDESVELSVFSEGQEVFVDHIDAQFVEALTLHYAARGLQVRIGIHSP